MWFFLIIVAVNLILKDEKEVNISGKLLLHYICLFIIIIITFFCFSIEFTKRQHGTTVDAVGSQIIAINIREINAVNGPKRQLLVIIIWQTWSKAKQNPTFPVRCARKSQLSVVITYNFVKRSLFETCRDESPSHIHHFHLCTFLVVFYSRRGSSSIKKFFRGRGKRLLQAQSDFGSLLWCEERLHKDTEVLGGRNCLLPRAWTRNVPLSSLR